MFWGPCVVTNVSVQYNGGLLPDIILLTPCDCIGKSFYPYSQCSDLNLKTIFPLRMDAWKV